MEDKLEKIFQKSKLKNQKRKTVVRRKILNKQTQTRVQIHVSFFLLSGNLGRMHTENEGPSMGLVSVAI